MTHYANCKNCALSSSPCERRDEIKNGIKGLSITSLKFKCTERMPMFRAGQRIEFDWRYYEEVEDNEYFYNNGENIVNLLFHGTAIQEVGSKFIVHVDAGYDASGEEIPASDVFKNDNLIIKVRPDDMRPIDKPARMLCSLCLAVEGKTENCYYRDEDFPAPTGCLSFPTGCLSLKAVTHE